MSGGNKRSYISLKQSWDFSMYDFLLPPGIKGLLGLHKCLQFAVITCIGFKQLRRMRVFRHFVLNGFEF